MLQIFISIIPLLFLIVIGFIAGKIYKLSTVQYGYMVAFILAPLVSFGAILKLEFKVEYIFLPMIVGLICASMCLISYRIAMVYLKGTLPNLAGMAASAGNTGFFGIPIFLLFIPVEKLGVYLLANLGMQIVENSLGYYIGTRGNCTIKQSCIKVLKMLPLWIVIIAIILNMSGVQMPEIAFDYWQKILDAWMVIGMMMIGIALASCANLNFDVKFCLHMLVMRFVMWPLLTAVIILLDYFYLQFLNPLIYFVLAIFSIVPLPGNSVAISATLGLHPEKMAFVVVLSVLVAAVFIPLVVQHIYGFIF